MNPIKRARIAAGLSQGEFAKKLGVSQVTACKWERGRGFPKVSRLKEVASVLQVPISELLEEKGAS